MCFGSPPFSVKVGLPFKFVLVLETDAELNCPVRVVSFAMRAVLAKSESAGENFNLVLAQQIIYGVGFFGILYSAYTMVLDRYDRLTVTRFHIADRLTGSSSRGPRVARLCRGSPETDSSFDSL